MPLLVGGFIVFAALASAGLAARVPPVVTWLDVGSPGDEEFTALFFPAEANSEETFRWTAERAELSVPTGRSGEYSVAIKLATVEPAGRTLSITCGDRRHDVDLLNIGADATAVVGCQAYAGNIDLTFDVPIVHLPNGGRPLGVSIRDIQVTALDSDDRRAARTIAAVTIFGSLAGIFFAARNLYRRSFVTAVLPTAALLVAWAAFIDRYPDGVLSAVSGPGGLITLIAGLTAILLHSGNRAPAAALAAVAVAAGLIWRQPLGSLVIESRWVMEELGALVIMPALAILAIVASVAIAGSRGHWLAAAGAALGTLSLVLPAIAARNVEHRLVQINAPDWTAYGGVAGAIYVLCVFALVGLAIIVARKSTLHPAVALVVVAAIGVSGLLLWRIQIMRFNGDEPHYYTTAWSLAEDRDLELLNNYVSERYQSIPHSPVGNIAVERADDLFRYAAATSGAPDWWLMIPNLPDGWGTDGDMAGLLPADAAPLFIRGPGGAVAAPPALYPARDHALLFDEPCRVASLVIGQPEPSGPVDLDITVLDQNGMTLWQGQAAAQGKIDDVPIPEESGLCAGSGNWTVQVSASQPVLVEALDHYNGLQIAAGQLQRGWLFGGMPRDLYGSLEVLSRVLLHNPSDAPARVTLRLITASDLTTSEITIGLQPGQTVVELLPVFGVTAVLITVDDAIDIAAALYGIVDGNRYRIPAALPSEQTQLSLPGGARYDAGVWITLMNLSPESETATFSRKGQVEPIEVCGYCATVRHESQADTTDTITIESGAGQPLAVTAVAYEERTGQLHYDIGLPLLAAPLAGFDATWPVLIVTAIAAVLLAPGLYLLAGVSGHRSATTYYFVAVVIMLAPLSTYAVRFYTDLMAGTLIVWALIFWDRGWRSNRSLFATAGIALLLPFLHGRLALLAAGLLGLTLIAAFSSNRERFGQYPLRYVIPVLALASLALLASLGILLSQYAVALSSRGIGDFFHLQWIMPNSVGMLLDRGSGVLPFAPWVICAIFVPRPLDRVQRASLGLSILYYALLTLRAGGWQTWGSPMRYLLPVFPLIAVLAITSMVRLWNTERLWARAFIAASFVWSLLTAILLHWLPLAGYIDRSTPGNDYLIDPALAWLPFPSPFKALPTIEALPGPTWGEPVGMAIVIGLGLWAALILWPVLAVSIRGPAETVDRRPVERQAP